LTEIDGEDGPELCMVMPKFVCDLKGAISGSALKQKGLKRRVAHNLLSAVAYLHDNGVMHRDIKTENVMFRDDMTAVLIDFGLAKLVDGYGRYGITHTSDCGTAGYMAPEVYAKEPYSLAADIWSVGIVLLEMFTGELNCERDKAAFVKVKALKAQLPDKPIPNLIKKLLEEDVSKRLTAHQALALPLFVEGKNPLPKVDVRLFVTAPTPNTGGENKRGKNGSKKKKTCAPAMCQKVCRTFGVESDFVPLAASKYFDAAYGSDAAKARIAAEAAEAKEAGEEYDTLSELSQWAICVILAVKIYEQEKIDVEECDEEFPEICGDFDIDQFIEQEVKVLRAMDFCMFLPFPVPDDDGNKKGKKKSRK